MKILLTGHLGFIGSNWIKLRHYEERGWITKCYDLKKGDDVRDKPKLEFLFETENFDLVIHCAALTGVRRGELYPEEYISTNIMGTKNLVDLSEKYGVKHFIHFSSSSIYADKKGLIKETEDKEPNSIYGMTKLVAEKIVQRSILPYCIIRPFTVYGENGRPDQVIMKWIRQIKNKEPITFYGNGDTGRGYTYIGDLIKAIMIIIDKKITGTYNVGGDVFVMLKELWELFGKPKRNILPLPFADRRSSIACTDKAGTVFRWQPKADFKTKVKEIIKNELL